MLKLSKLLFLALFALPFPLHAQMLQTEPTIILLKSPIYPTEALKTGLGGVVTVHVNVDEFGKVTKTNNVSGPDFVCPDVLRADVVSMQKLSSDAAREVTFKPEMVDGKPVAFQTYIKFSFTDPMSKKISASNPSSSGSRVYNFAYGSEFSKETEPSTTDRFTETIGALTLFGLPKSMPHPSYPAAARAVRAQGSVEIKIVIDTNGTVFSTEAIRGHPLLQTAARIAACKARFRPTLLCGKPVLLSGIVTFSFVP